MTGNASLVKLVDSYRRHGHRASRLDPLNLIQRRPVPALDPRRYGFALPADFHLEPEHISPVLPDCEPIAPIDQLYNTDGILYFGDSEDQRLSQYMNLPDIVRRLDKTQAGHL